MMGIEYPALPQTAVEYINAVWKAYVHTREFPQYLVIYVSPELFKAYKDGCLSSLMYRTGPIHDDWSPEPQLVFRNARVKQDPDLQGHKVRFLEDKFAYGR